MADLDTGPLHSVSAALTTMFIERANRKMEMVRPVIIAFSCRCQSHVIRGKSQPEIAVVFLDEVLDLAGYMVACQGSLDHS